jgi:AraC family transcriptional regulator
MTDDQSAATAHRLPPGPPGARRGTAFGFGDGREVPCIGWRAERLDCDHSGGAPVHLLTLHLRGGPIARLGAGRSATTQPGMFGLLPVGQPARWQAGRDVAFAHLYLPSGFLGALASGIDVPDPARIALREDRAAFEDADLAAMVRAYLARAADPHDPPPALEMGARATLIGLHLLRRHSALPPPRRPAAATRLSPVALARIKALIEAEIAEHLPLARLAAEAGMELNRFARAFRAATGEPPHRFLLGRRIAHARRLLLDGRLGLAEVAAASGFASQSHMTATVTRHLGVSPGRLRGGR